MKSLFVAGEIDREPMLTVDDVAERFNTSRTLVLDEVRRGNLRAYRFGRILRFYESDVVEYVTDRQVAARDRSTRGGAR